MPGAAGDARKTPTGVAAVKRDSAGRYYVLAKPANVIRVYDQEGKQVGQIPDAKSPVDTIRYAVDMAIAPDGRVLVADRSANAVASPVIGTIGSSAGAPEAP